MDLAQKPVYKLDLAAGTSVVNLTTPLVEGDDRAQTFALELTDKGAPANLKGYSVTAYFGRGKTAEAEADTIPLSGTVSGNVATITLTESCYSRSCYFSMPIRLSNGATGQKRTYLIVRGTVVKSVDGKIIDPDGSVPSLDDLFAQIAVMERSRQAAEEAAEEALAAATRADEAREGIQGDLAALTKEIDALVNLKVDNLVEIVKGKYATFDDNGLFVADLAASGYVKIGCSLGSRIKYSITTPNAPYTMCIVAVDENNGVVGYVNNGTDNNDGIFDVPPKTKYIYFNFNAAGDSHIPVYLTEYRFDDLQGKKVACFGDSITWYDGQVYNWGKEEGQICVGYESYLREQLGLHVDNYGLSGHTMPMIAERGILNPSQYGNPTPDFTMYDYITITSGANDERLNVPVGEVKPFGSVYDTSTYIGALQQSLDYILSINKNVKILLITPIMGWIYAPNGYEYERTEDGIVTDKWANAIKEVGKMYSLPVLDWYNESGINLWTRINYINDPEPVTHGGNNDLYSLHPTKAGYKRMAHLLMEKIKGI